MVSIVCGILAMPVGAGVDAGMEAVKRADWGRALKEFQPAAEKGETAAQINLGNLYMKGLGVPQDYRAAYDWYLKAAEKDDPVAQNKLGLLHYYGLGVAREHREASQWFRRAASQGEPGAQFILGLMLSAGDGLPKDSAEAYLWFTLAAEQHHPEAAQHRAALADAMSPGDLNDALARLENWRNQNEPNSDPVTALQALGSTQVPASAPRPRVDAARPEIKSAKAKPEPKSSKKKVAPRTNVKVPKLSKPLDNQSGGNRRQATGKRAPAH